MCGSSNISKNMGGDFVTAERLVFKGKLTFFVRISIRRFLVEPFYQTHMLVCMFEAYIHALLPETYIHIRLEVSDIHTCLGVSDIHTYIHTYIHTQYRTQLLRARFSKKSGRRFCYSRTAYV